MSNKEHGIPSFETARAEVVQEYLQEYTILFEARATVLDLGESQAVAELSGDIDTLIKKLYAVDPSEGDRLLNEETNWLAINKLQNDNAS